jgi:hypothetical protein
VLQINRSGNDFLLPEHFLGFVGHDKAVPDHMSDVGVDQKSPVNPVYKGKSKFTGKIIKSLWKYYCLLSSSA